MDLPEPVKTHHVRCLKCNKILECSPYDTNTLFEHIRNDHPELEIVEDDFDDKRLKGNNGTKASYSTNGTYSSNGTNCTNCTPPHNVMERSKLHGSAKRIVVPRNKSDECECPQSVSSRERFRIRSERIDGRGKQNASDGDERKDHSNDTGSATYTRRYRVQTPSSYTQNEQLQPQPQQQPQRSLYRTSIEKWRPANGTIYCPKCGANRRPLIRTQTERSSNNSCCAVCILGCWPFCFLPFLVPSDNKEYLHCSNCKTFLGLYDRSNNCVKPNREYIQPEDRIENEPEMFARQEGGKEKRNCRCA